MEQDNNLKSPSVSASSRGKGGAAAWFANFLKKLVPEEEFGALEIGEKNIRYILFSKYDLKPRVFVEVKLEPGVVVKGELKNKAGLVSALNEIKKAAGYGGSKTSPAGATPQSNAAGKSDLPPEAQAGRAGGLPVIVTLSSANFFFNVIELPDVPETSYDEAVRLNLSQATPISLDSAYSDWQNLGVNLKTLQREFLIAVASRSKIDAYLECFEQVGFEPLALESRSLSLLRNFNYFSQTIEKTITLLMVEIGEDGISFMIGKSGKLFFDFYLFWDEIPETQDQKIDRSDLEIILSREVRRTIEYFSQHEQEQILHFALFSPILKKELEEFLVQKFNLRRVAINLPGVSADKASDVFAGLIGAGLRGSLIPRELDDIVSLLPEGTEKIYKDKRILRFVSLWIKISVAGILGSVIVLGSTFLIVAAEKNKIFVQLNSLKTLPELNEIYRFNEEAGEFNKAVEQVSNIERNYRSWSDFLAPIIETAQSQNISISRLSLAESSNQIKVRAKAQTQKNALDFQKAMLGNVVFSDAEIPLSSFSQTPQGTEFEIVLTLKLSP